jgi:hypothetical protein
MITKACTRYREYKYPLPGVQAFANGKAFAIIADNSKKRAALLTP